LLDRDGNKKVGTDNSTIALGNDAEDRRMADAETRPLDGDLHIGEVGTKAMAFSNTLESVVDNTTASFGIDRNCRLN
jgi:hypothetical protein